MVSAWVNLSTRWDLTSVQATLNVLISVLGTIGVWAFSRYWWQRSCATLLRRDSEVPLSSLLILSSPGEGWDALTVLRRRIFSKQHWYLLVQLVVIVSATLACMLAGPIAKVSLRVTTTVQNSQLGVLNAVKGDSYQANLLEANVFWNDTIASLNRAKFPTDQMLDYLPPTTTPWTYIPDQWNPTWTMDCSFTEETPLHNLTAVGNHTFLDPIDAFPPYRDTYESRWLDESMYRRQVDISGWSTTDPAFHFTDELFFILIGSDPVIDDRMYTNNATMEISFSVLHFKNFNATNIADTTLDAEDSWVFFGPVESANYTRLECNISRKPEVAEESSVPWIWTNDTYAITFGFRTYFSYMLENATSKGLPVETPSPLDLLRLWQTYMITMNTIYAFPTSREVGVLMDTVQISIGFLTAFILLTLMTVWSTFRYFIFRRRHKKELEELYIPDSKLEWMVHGAKVVEGEGEEFAIVPLRKDRDHLQVATFGRRGSVLENGEPVGPLQTPGLARIHLCETHSTHRASLKNGLVKVSSGQSSPMASRSSSEATTRLEMPCPAVLRSESSAQSSVFKVSVEEKQEGED